MYSLHLLDCISDGIIQSIPTHKRTCDDDDNNTLIPQPHKKRKWYIDEPEEQEFDEPARDAQAQPSSEREVIDVEDSVGNKL